MTIVCALRWGVASVGRFSTGRGSPYKGKYFRCGIDTGERRSFKVACEESRHVTFNNLFVKCFGTI